jgi:fatty acid desaturase
MNAREFKHFSRKYAHLGANDFKASLQIFLMFFKTALSVALSVSNSPMAWFLGQILFAVVVLQWFVLIHDFGHANFFKHKALNDLFGFIASLFCLVPYFPWKRIHGSHHRWTGWQDLDPTTQRTALSAPPKSERALIDLCWKYWIPIFTLAFSFGNFWNLKKSFAYAESNYERVLMVVSIILPVGFLALALYFFGFFAFLKVWGLGYLFFLLISDPLLLSQHAHVPQKRSENQKVKEFPFFEQAEFTRTLLFPKGVSKHVLLNFDSHATHHLWQWIPSYNLGSVEKFPFENRIHWKKWLNRAKAMPASRLLFENSNETKIIL